ncbi:ABC transporter ATP-binding protein [candidate division KSB1 bacterium]|nr:ABC transporter ATP-binding protein [candidate division KSB1 bacterium]
MKLYFKVIKFFKPYWKHISTAIIFSMFYVLFNSLAIWMAPMFINTIFSGQENVREVEKIDKNVQSLPKQELYPFNLNNYLKDQTRQFIQREDTLLTLKILCLVILFSFLLKNFFRYCQVLLSAYVEHRVVQNLRDRIYEHLHRLSLHYFSDKKTGELISIMTNDVTILNTVIGNSFEKILREPINILIFLGILFIISWKLTLISLILLPLSAVLITKIGQSIRRKSRRSLQQIAGITTIMQETLAGIRIVKAFAMELFEVNRFKRETEKYFKIVFRQKKLQSLSSPLSESLGLAMGVFLLWYGGREVLHGGLLTPEDFMRFIIVLFALVQPLRNLGGLNNYIQQGLAAAQRVFDLLETEPRIIDRKGAISLRNFKDRISYHGVHFKYNEKNDLVLRDINLEIRKGEVLALVGSSGAGKSTLVDLLPRFYDPTSGRMEIDGIDLRDVTLKSLRDLIGIVTQETILFNDTVRNNIAYGLRDVDQDRIEAAARAANALGFIQHMDRGFETSIGERGTKLSGGQRQRLAIARALLKNPPILILDEATAALDTESERLVQAAIERLMEERTVLVIAHRLSTVKRADRIVVLEEGRIVEEGTHHELIKKRGIYRRLYQMQFGTDKT